MMRKLRKVLTSLLAAAAAAVCLPFIAGGLQGETTVYAAGAYTETYSVKVDSGYLALRTAKAYDSANEIGRLWTGDTVEVFDRTDPQYWYVYAPTLNSYGYVNKDYLRPVSPAPTPVYGNYTVRVESGYLALRTAKAYDSSNEIGKLWTGDTVQVTDASDPQYWYVYAPTLGRYGYVNKDYLYGSSASSGNYGVRVDSGYLALRTAKAYDSANEIGKLWNGDTVQVIDSSDSTYWYVYAPTLGKYGYVNRNYIYAMSSPTPSYQTYTVRVSSGYLALRTAKAYDAANEIGKLWTGDTVQVIDRSSGQYWYVYAPTLGKYGYVNKDYLY